MRARTRCASLVWRCWMRFFCSGHKYGLRTRAHKAAPPGIRDCRPPAHGRVYLGLLALEFNVGSPQQQTMAHCAAGWSHIKVVDDIDEEVALFRAGHSVEDVLVLKSAPAVLQHAIFVAGGWEAVDAGLRARRVRDAPSRLSWTAA